MNLTTIKTACLDAVATATGLTDVKWADEADATGWVEPVFVRCRFMGLTGVGVDEIRHTYNSGTDQIEEDVQGQREFTLSVRIESDSQDPGETAPGQYAALLRTRLRRRGVLATLHDAGIAMRGIEATQEAQGPTTQEGRVYSVAVVDVLLSVAEVDSDDTATGDYIGTVELSSDTLDDPAGDPTAEQVDEVITS